MVIGFWKLGIATLAERSELRLGFDSSVGKEEYVNPNRNTMSERVHES